MEKKNQCPAVNTRRKFLKTTSGITLYLGVGGIIPSFGFSYNQNNPTLIEENLTAWVKLTSDGTITIYNPAAEMGQGSMTALPIIFAEEFDADWSKVKVEFSAQEPSIYGSEGWGGRKIQLTAGSRTVKGYYNVLRKAGAQARQIMLQNVAKKWQVPQPELSTVNGVVFHKKSNQNITYGDIVPFMKIPSEIPEISEEMLKKPEDFRLIGKDIPRTDIPSKINGSAKFASDINLPNMVYGTIQRGTRHGAIATLLNKGEIGTMNGVITIVDLGYGIGIISDTVESGLLAKQKMKIEWSESKASNFNSQEVYSSYEKLASKNDLGRIITDQGDFNTALKQAVKIYEADYLNDYVYHAQMEPVNAIVQISEDGQSAEVWAGHQQGFTPKLGVPGELKIDPSKVKVNLQYLGGGLGRRSMNDYVIECTKLAKMVAPKPVKLQWSREDDLTYGAYRPISLQRLKATVDDNNEVTGISHIVVGDGDNLVASGIKNMFYNIPNQHAEIRKIEHGVRMKHWRAVGHGPNKFAIECLIDDIAHGQGVNPVRLRRTLMKESPKALATLNKAVEISGWFDEPLPGRAKGIAFLERSGTLSTGVCEISLNKTSGKIIVHHFWSAINAGVVIQPDNVKAQMEGGIIMGMSSVFKEQLTIKDGHIQQSNFHDYHLLRMGDVPETIDTFIIKSTDPPQGVGESGTPLAACCIANAFFALTGKRLRHLPFTPDRVLKVLES